MPDNAPSAQVSVLRAKLFFSLHQAKHLETQINALRQKNSWLFGLAIAETFLLGSTLAVMKWL